MTINKEQAIEEGWYSPNQLDGKCYCGCGNAAPLAVQSSRKRKWITGEPLHYITGHNNGYNFGGGRTDERGYVLIFLPKSHPRRGMANQKSGYVRQHRLVMAEHLGRNLTSNEIVHHLNGDKGDNRLENLQLVSDSEHRTIHNQENQKAAELLREIQKRGLTLEDVWQVVCGA